MNRSDEFHPTSIVKKEVNVHHSGFHQIYIFFLPTQVSVEIGGVMYHGFKLTNSLG